jgi:hypothetical protein
MTTLKVVSDVVTTPQQWVRIIKRDLRQAVAGFVTAGVHLIEAKAQVDHGDWLRAQGSTPVHRPGLALAGCPDLGVHREFVRAQCAR